MDRIGYLKQGKNLLRSIKAQREYLLKHGKSHIDVELCRKEIRNVEGALASIHSSDQMRCYLVRKEAELRYLIPANNRKRQRELRELLEVNL